ncbi:MFS transporter [Nocardioides yefusunii]|uniref:MFS transporter n=1 Tax=Nocardioides yefusunii TaxID=2500546 RepID=A0ABW1QTM4_9ACTN|nr:MFS transporter [Nocardioides yefusunii]
MRDRATRPGSATSAPDATSALHAPSALDALRVRLFALLMTVQLVNAIAVWAHVVTVQWTLTERGESAAVVSLAPASLALPFLLLSLPVGAWVGFAPRGRLLIASTAASVLAALVGAALGAAGDLHWTAMVGTVLVVGAALVVTGVTWQAMIPDVVGRHLMGSASVVDGSAYNVARAVGPLLAGVGLGWVGVSGTFVAVSLLFGACTLVLLVVEVRHPSARGPRRPIVGEMLGGLRFTRHSPWTRRLLTRMVCFGLPASALWALVSLVVHDRLGLGSTGFGVVMALVGSGAVVATFVLPPLRGRLSVPVFAALGSGLYALTLLVMGLVTVPAVVGGVLVLGGVAWVGVQSTWMTLAQQALPEWVRPRVIALLLFLFQGTQAIGSFAWGVVADLVGLPAALVAAAVAMCASIVVLLRLGLASAEGIEPVLVEADDATHGLLTSLSDLEPGPIEVTHHYSVLPGRSDDFVRAMEPLRLSRLRTGATRWRLHEPAGGAHAASPWVENYVLVDPVELFAQETERLTVPEMRLRTAVHLLADRVEGPFVSSSASTPEPPARPARRADSGQGTTPHRPGAVPTPDEGGRE